MNTHREPCEKIQGSIIFPGMLVPASSPQGQTVECPEKVQQSKELHLILYRSQLACEMLKFRTVQFDKDQTSMACLKRVSKRKPLKSTVFSENQTAFVKHSGGGLMIWACFAVTGHGPFPCLSRP